MPEYKHIDKKEYLIAEGAVWRVWNNGIVEYFSYLDGWLVVNDQTWERRLEFLKCWEYIPIDSWTIMGWINCNPWVKISSKENGCQKFLGFRGEQCPECKKSNLIWEGKIQLCKKCEYIHAFMVDDDS